MANRSADQDDGRYNRFVVHSATVSGWVHLASCVGCGAVVRDMDAHDRWHENQDDTNYWAGMNRPIGG